MMTRMQFLRSVSLGALGLGGVVLAACKQDDVAQPQPDASYTPPLDAPPMAMPDAYVPPPATCTSTTNTISSNHGHVITVSPAELAAGEEKTYQIQGTSNHPHTVKISAAQFAMLKQNHTLMVTSSMDAGHTHYVTLMCA